MESVTHYHVYAYHKSGGDEAKRFEGNAVTASAQAIHYADQIAHTCDYADVRDAVGNLTYTVRDPHGKLAKQQR
jgi:hypothetical protein